MATTVHVYFFDVEGQCTDPNVESLQVLEKKNQGVGTTGQKKAYWINPKYTLGSIYICKNTWCFVAYQSVLHSGPANISWAHVYNVLDALRGTKNQTKMIHLTNYRDLLSLYQTRTGLLKIEKLLLPSYKESITVM